MRKLSLLAAAQRLLAADYIQFVMHTHPDGDTFGSCFGAATLLEAAGKRCDVVCADVLPERFAPFANRPLLSPAAGEDAFEAEKGEKLICAVDVAAPKQFGEAAGYYVAKTGLLLDHHEYGIPVSDYYIDIKASAAGEIIYDLAAALKRLNAINHIPKKALEFIYIAISADTGCFRFSNTSSRTHKTAAKIMDFGVNCADIEYQLHISKPLKQLEAERIVYNSLQIYLNGAFAAVLIDNASRQGIPLEYFDTAVDIARSVKGVGVGCTIKQDIAKPGEFRVSMRSDGKADVAAICTEFGGGGHFAAAGCTLCAASAENALEMILKAAEKKLKVL